MAKTKALGAPKIEGADPVGGKDAPALFFGSTKINNAFDVVDAVAQDTAALSLCLQGPATTSFASRRT